MIRTLRFAPVLVLCLGCDVEFGRKPVKDAALAARIAEARAAVAQRPGDAQALLVLGERYADAELWFDAAEHLKQAEVAKAEPRRLHAALAHTYFELGYFDSAMRSVITCLRTDRTVAGCIFVYGRLLELGRTEEALKKARDVYRDFVTIAPDHPKAALARSSIDQIDATLGPRANAGSQPASQPADPAAAAAPPAAEAGSEGGAGADEANVAATPDTLKAVPGHGDGEANEDVGELNAYGQAVQRALAASRQSDVPATIAAYQEALKLRPNDPFAQAGLAEVYFVSGEREKASQEIAKAYASHPNDPQVMWTYGLVMLQNNGHTDQAFAAWERLAREHPEVAKELGLDQRLETARRFMKKE